MNSPFSRVCFGVYYLPQFLSEPDAALEEIDAQVNFTQRSRKLYGRTVKTPRLEAWFGPTPYAFGGSSLPAQSMPPVIESIGIRASMWVSGHLVERGSANFDSCLVNLYRDGRDSVGWHSDDEPEMGDPLIASVSLGATRTFALRRRPERRAHARAMRIGGAPGAGPDGVKLELAHGSLLVMLRGAQSEWSHSLPKRHGVLDRRINLTYRQPG